MDTSTLLALVDRVHKHRVELLSSKGHDYSTAENVLLNFQQVSQLCKILDVQPSRSTRDAIMFQVLHKLQRWCNLHGAGKMPKNESVESNIADLHNYIDLCFAEEQEELTY